MSEITVRCCRDALVIEQILRQDAFDTPIPYFPRSLLRVAIRELLATSADTYFVVAERQGQYAGFALGHTLGPAMWRKFARQQWSTHPLAIAVIVWRLRVLLPLRSRLNRWRRRRPEASEPGHMAGQEINVPRINRPFAWSTDRPGTGQVDQLFVRPESRGLGLAPLLLRHLVAAMAERHVPLVEAHVDEWNRASLRAFLTAGWQAFQTTGGDFYVCCRPQFRSPGTDDTTGVQ